MDLENKKVICSKCKKEYTGQQAFDHHYICSDCGKYMPIGAKERLAMVLNEATFEPWFEEVGICDPLGTPGYPEKLAAAQKKTAAARRSPLASARSAGIRP